MSFIRRRGWVRTLVIVILALILVVIAVQFWLSSGIGRGVVENRLSAALGRPARLDGEFSIRLLPVPGVAGTKLRLFTRDGRWLLVDAGGYLLRLSLWPLLKGDLHIVALKVEDAAIDLERLLAESSAPPAPDAAAPMLAVPDISSFELAEVTLYFDGIGSEPFVRIDKLSVDAFTIDSPARFETGLALVGGGAEQLAVFADGTLTLRGDGVLETGFTRVDAALAAWDVRGISGRMTAALGRSTLDIGLEWSDPDQRVRLGTTVAWDPGYPDPVGGYAIDTFELVLDGQKVEGSGCFLDGSPPVLNLDLAAAGLDVDAIAALSEKWRVPQPGPVEAEEPGADAGLQPGESPVSLAVRLAIEQATYEEAVATKVRLNVGAPPDCPEAR